MSSPDPTLPQPAGREPPLGPKRRRPWRRWFKVLAILVVIAAVVARIAIEVLLPTVVRRVANVYDLDCTYDRMSLSLFGGNAQVWNLVLRPKQGGDSIVHADYVHGMLSIPKLLRGRLVAYRAEVDGVDVVVARESDGSIPLLAQVVSATRRPGTPSTSGPTSRPVVSLQPPLRIDAIRLSQVKTTFRDRSVTPVFETTVRTTVRLSDVGVAGRPARVRVQVDADPVMDSLLVEGELRSEPEAVNADVSVVVRGVHPKAAAAYLRPLGLNPVATSLSVRARATVAARLLQPTSELSAAVSLSDVAAVVDGAEAASLKALVIDATNVGADAIQVKQVLVKSGRVSAARNPTGTLTLAGFELLPSAARGGTVAATSHPVRPSTRPEMTPPGLGSQFRFAVAGLRVEDVTASFVDHGVVADGHANLSAHVNEMTAANFVYDPADPEARVSVHGSATLPEVARSVSWNGVVTPFAPTRRAKIEVRGTGIRPNALRPYLDLVGLKSEIEDGAFSGSVDVADVVDDAGGHVIDAAVSNVRLSDGGKVLVDLPAFTAKGLMLGPSADLIRVESVDISGPTTSLRFDADGTLAGGGLRLVSPVAPRARSAAIFSATKPTGPQSPGVTVVAGTIPRVEIGSVSWRDAEISVTDATADGEAIELSGTAGFEASRLLLDLRADRPQQASPPGRFRAWAELPGVTGRVSAEGTLAAGPHGAAVDVELAADGLTGALVGKYLRPLGIQPTLHDGRFRMNARGELAIDGAGDAIVNADLRNASFSDGEKELLGADALALNVTANRDRITVERLELARPRGGVRRNADGTLEAAGIKVLLPDARSRTRPTTAPSPLRLRPAPIVINVTRLQIRDGSLAIEDLAATPPLKTGLRGTVSVANASLASADRPATIDIAGGVDGIVDHAHIAGRVSLAPDAPAAQVTVDADGIHPGAIAAYLPPNVVASMKDGRFAATLDAAVANAKAGGVTGHAIVHDLALTERQTGDVLAKVGAFTLRASRVDPAEGLYAIDEVSSSGVEAGVARGVDGSLELLGVRLVSPTTAVPSTPAIGASAPHASTEPAPAVAALVAEARRSLPLLTVTKLDLAVARLGLRGFTAGPDAPPVSVARFRAYSDGPISLGGSDADQGPPLNLRVQGGVEPIIKEFTVAARTAPLAPEVTLAIDVKARGINGRGLTDVFPELKSVIVGDPLTDGTFVARVDASINYTRRGPRDIDLTRGFTATIGVKPVEFRGVPDGPVLAGVGEVRVEGLRVQPRAGDVSVKLVELSKPVGRLLRDEQGLHVFGMVIPLRAQAATAVAPPERVATPSPEPSTTTPGPAGTGDASPPEGGELRLDRLLVSGIDLVFEDRTTTPVTFVPLKTLDLDVRDVSNRMLWTGRPIQFDLLCTADAVPLPPRRGIRHKEPAEGGEEMRELFSQVTASGRVGMKRTSAGTTVLTGRAKTSVNGFELLGVRGIVAQQKLTIRDGIFDDTNDIRFKDDGTIETRNRIVFTNLSVTEPSDGPVRQALALPVPLDAAIGAVTDADGSITMDLPVTIESGAVSTDQLLAPAIGAVGQVLVTATASAPIKAVEGVGGLLGLDGGKAGKAKPQPPVTIEFLPGVTTLGPAEARQLAALGARLNRDRKLEVQLRHEFTSADVERLRFRANPSADDIGTTAARLRRDKAALLSQRDATAADARIAFASGRTDAARRSVRALQGIDRQLAGMDRALDQLYDLLRPGADGQADRRTRAAGLAIARERLDLVQQALSGASAPVVSERIRRTNPQFEIADDPADGDADHAAGGRVVITLVPRKR